MDEARQVLQNTRIIVYALYGGVALYAASVLLRLPPVEQGAVPAPALLLPLLGAAAATFALALFLGEQRLSVDHLLEKQKLGPLAAAREVQTGAVIMAALGDGCGSFGLVFYFLTGQREAPLLFFALAAVHAVLTLRRLGRAERAIAGS